MTGVLRKGIGLVVVLFLFWYVFTSPNEAAHTFRDIGTWMWSTMVQLFQSIIRFLTAIFSG
jgi:hypothetical protein